jgi:hypothetical protein
MPNLIWFVLGTDGCTVRAYRDEVAARKAVSGCEVRYVSDKGSKKTRNEADFALLVPSNDVYSKSAANRPRASASYDLSLLTTNVQKAVRRQDADVARLTVRQYFGQRPTKGSTEYYRKLLLRLPVIAAEDAAARPGLALAIFLYLGATSWDNDSVLSRSVEAIAECAAELALAPRDITCVADSDAWSRKREAPVSANQIDALCPEDAALVWLLGAASKILERGSPDHSADAKWVASLQASVLTQAQARCEGFASAFASPASGAMPEGPGGAEVDLPTKAQYFFSADFHNKERCQALMLALQNGRAAGAPVAAKLAKLTSAAALKAAMKPHAYLNLRDAPFVHLLNHKKPVTAADEAFVAWWASEATKLWAAKPAKSQDLQSLWASQSTPASVVSGGQPAAKKQKTG